MLPRALPFATLLAAAACAPPAPAAAGLIDRLALAELVGTWRWEHVVDEPELRRRESERWQFWPNLDAAGELRGRYLREVSVQSAGAPFVCNGAARYAQRASFEIVARARRGAVEIVETDYTTQPSPCDHGLRRLGSYSAVVSRGRAELSFAAGAQVLWRVDDTLPSPPRPPWPDDDGPIAGAWRWDHHSVDGQGHDQWEEELWTFTGDAAANSPASLRDGASLTARYVRRVTVATRDGSELPCAAAPSYGYEDRVTLEGARRDGILLLRELAIAAGEHPCLQPSATRSLDTAVLDVLGSEIALQWRGKRRQVLRRPER